jgi:hypothetical protein
MLVPAAVGGLFLAVGLFLGWARGDGAASTPAATVRAVASVSTTLAPASAAAVARGASAPTEGEACTDAHACGGLDLDAKAGRAAPVALPRGEAVLLEFSSEHCGACQKAGTIIQEVERACDSAGAVMRVDVDEDRGAALASKHAVKALPTFVALDAQGRETDRFVGAPQPARLARALEGVRGAKCKAL